MDLFIFFTIQIKSKSIFAQINQQDGTVHFLDDPEHYDSNETLQILQEKVSSITHLVRYGK